MDRAGSFKKIPVAYTPKQVSNPSSFSPSPMKPAWVVERWLTNRYPIRIVEPVPVDREAISLAHQPAYVDGVLDLTVDNGFGSRCPSVAESLPYTSGSMWRGALEALHNGMVAVSPSSRFHHASYTAGGGYCTFNGLMITAQLLLHLGWVRKVGILDCGQHFGDGTEDIIRRLRLRSTVRHVTAGRGYPRKANEFLRRLPEIVFRFADCELLLYQAGADPHYDDPLGGWLSTEQLHERDSIVFSMVHQMGVPVVWNLAGGYQRPVERVLDIHDNTLRACFTEFLGRDMSTLPTQGLSPKVRAPTHPENCHV